VKKLWVTSVAAATATLALGAPTAYGQTVATSKAAANQTLLQPLHTTRWRWASQNPPTRMEPVATHICLVTKVSGKFAGYGERVGLSIDTGATGGARWVLNGTSGQQQLAIEATCAPKAQFVTKTAFTMNATVLPAQNHNKCVPKTTLYKTDASQALFLAGLAGKFGGGGEAVIVDEKTMVMHGCSGAVEGSALVVRASPLRVYRTQTGRTPFAKDSTYTIGISQPKDHWLWGEPYYKEGERKVFLVPADEALCGLTRVQGNFQGYGESAAVDAEKGPDGRLWWVLSAGTLASASTTTAGARCLARDQR